MFDIRGRVVSFNAHTPVEMTIDALLRLHADPKRWQKPITLYVGLGMDFQRPAKTIEALSVCGVLGCLRSPIHTVAVGIINQSNALVLAAGNPGHRYMLPHSMVWIGTQTQELPTDSPGLNQNNSSLHSQAQALLQKEVATLTRNLGLDPNLWNAPNIISATEAIEARIADRIVPVYTPNLTPDHEQKL